jgi:hypothetical protein
VWLPLEDLAKYSRGLRVPVAILECGSEAQFRVDELVYE